MTIENYIVLLDNLIKAANELSLPTQGLLSYKAKAGIIIKQRDCDHIDTIDESYHYPRGEYSFTKCTKCNKILSCEFLR